MDEKQHKSRVPFLFSGMKDGDTLTVFDTAGRTVARVADMRGAGITFAGIPVGETLMFGLRRGEQPMFSGTFRVGGRGESLDLKKFTKAKEPDPPSEAYGTCYACGKELLEVADFNSTFFKDARRDWCEAHNPGLDEPIDATADDLRREGCVWAGVYEGALVWERLNPPAVSHLVSRRVFASRDAKALMILDRHKGEHCVVWPGVGARLRAYGLLTRGGPAPEKYGLPPWALDKNGAVECRWCGAGSGYGAGTPADRRAAVKAHLHNRGCSLSPQKDPTIREGAGEGPTPTKREKAVAKVVAETAEALAPAFAEIADYVQREKVWGDMRTPREPTGPILTCGEPGHVTLHLERLSDDREKAMKQLSAASEEMAGRKCRQPIRARGTTLRAKLLRTRIALKVGWPLAPYLQAIRDAHEAIGIEREWKANKVKPASVSESITFSAKVDGAKVSGSVVF